MWIAQLIPSRILSLQAKQPKGLMGRYLMSKIFNQGNADLNTFVKENLQLNINDQVLEIGFGPGQLIQNMAAMVPQGKIHGVDFSKAMLQEATRRNQKYIHAGLIELKQAECRQLEFSAQSFDKVCSSNTVYFWKEPLVYFQEMHRVLKPGGKVVIGFRDKPQIQGLNLSKDIFNLYSQTDIVELLLKSGFVQAQIKEKPGQPFVSYCAVAHKAG